MSEGKFKSRLLVVHAPPLTSQQSGYLSADLEEEEEEVKELGCQVQVSPFSFYSAGLVQTSRPVVQWLP